MNIERHHRRILLLLGVAISLGGAGG